MMNEKLRALFLTMMSLALMFGFFHHAQLEIPFNFDRLHIFLFNLCSGGAIILYFTENQHQLTLKVKWFIGLSLAYALTAFFNFYPPAILIALIMAGIVESVRIKRFSWFPLNFFQSRAPVSEKFHQASLLCLSIGLVISSLVIINNEYLNFIAFPKLTLNTFFLGFSFPLSLITFSVIFSLMKHDSRTVILIVKDISFWFINLGVIIFFIFILIEKPAIQLVVTTVLSLTVIMVFRLFSVLGVQVQQKSFLISGISFLLLGAFTGILYIILEFFPQAYTPESSKLIMRIHSFASLYGWNLSGLAMICRFEAFPLKLNSGYAIGFHWLIVVVLAPLGMYFPWAALSAVIGYTLFLYMLFSREHADSEIDLQSTAKVECL